MNSMSLEFARCRNIKAVGRHRQIIILLKMLGVPSQMLYFRRLRQNGSFWLRKINHLQVLELARQLCQRQIVCVHPDKEGGNTERAMQLNWMWGEIERRFKQHGLELGYGSRAVAATTNSLSIFISIIIAPTRRRLDPLCHATQHGRFLLQIACRPIEEHPPEFPLKNEGQKAL
jgi:hypothetical protein